MVFTARQEGHRKTVVRRLTNAFERMKATVRKIYAHFREDPRQIQLEFRRFVNRVDSRVEQALRATVKKSLQELSRAINGDSKTEPQPLFRVHVVLDGVTNKVEFNPSIIHLTQSVNVVSKELITIVKSVPRLHDVLHDELEDLGIDKRQLQQQSFFDLISNDEDTLKILVAVMNGMSSSGTELHRHLAYWDKYKAVWEMDNFSLTNW